MIDLEARRVATEATLAKYRQRPLDFATADCARMVRYHLLQLGHKPPKMPSYRSATGARRAYVSVGGLAAAFDAILPRIPHARMLLGDIAVLDGDGGMDAAVICVGHKVFGWHEDSDVPVNLVPLQIKAAWRV
ncbi:DUF6950 family protein [Sphingobium sp. WCS2017Hpa-17]|uniref:DUF6950 family protein n=1 Tax=Sphingobium sp. WCS2017Hpa-17 TaxID=3073638 RepID=UPI00288BDABE|nr:hypothetical protein [Sphingobium sp. WCS2017Hpa-17]